MDAFTILHIVICKDFQKSTNGYNYLDVVPSIATNLPFDISGFKLVGCFFIADNLEHSFEVLFYPDSNRPAKSLGQVLIPNTAKPIWTWELSLPCYTVNNYKTLLFQVQVDKIDDEAHNYYVPLIVSPHPASGIRHLNI